MAVKGSTTVPLSELQEFQGELKSLSKENYEKLKAEIANQGFSFTVHIWLDGGKPYILDGHQRVRTMRKMVEEGWECPAIPVSVVEAENASQAKRKLLGAASQYGKIEKQGLYEFVVQAGIEAEELVAQYEIPGVDLPSFNEEFLIDSADDALNISNISADAASDGPINPDNRQAPSGIEPGEATSHVRMVQLFLDDASQPEFLEMTSQLAKHYQTANLTDTVLEIVRADYRAKNQN